MVYSSFSDRVDGYGLDSDLALAFLWSVVFLFPLPTETVFFDPHLCENETRRHKVENINNSGKTPCRHAKRFDERVQVVFTMYEKSLCRGPEAPSGNLLIVCVSRYALYISLRLCLRKCLCVLFPFIQDHISSPLRFVCESSRRDCEIEVDTENSLK